MQEPRTWREFLATMIREPKDKQRIASEMGVDPVTLSRWATKESSPRPRSLLNRLVEALPQHRESLSELIEEEFPRLIADDFLPMMGIEKGKEVSPALYSQVLLTLS